MPHKKNKQKKQALVVVRHRRWLHFYKFLACIAFGALVTPYFEFLITFAAQEFATALTVIGMCFLLPVGYGFHALFRLLFVRKNEQEFSFSFETKWQFSSSIVLVPSLVLGSVVALIFGFQAGDFLKPRLYPFYNEEVGFPVMVIACVAVVVLGGLLVPLQFHQLCSLRTMLECLVALALPYGLSIFWGNGVNNLFGLCVLTYAFCLFILMNQEYVIKPSYTSKTCYATKELRWSGIKWAVKLWAQTVAVALLLVALITPIGLLLNSDQSSIWLFPFAGWPVVNRIMCTIGLTIIPTAAIFLILRFGSPKIWRALGRRWTWLWENVSGATIRFLRRLHFRKKVKKTVDNVETVTEEPKKQHYVDTVTKAKANGSGQHTIGYREFTAKLKKIDDQNARYRYAYEVLIGALWHAQIGVETSQTPLEMSRIIAKRTNINNMNTLTEIYIGITYGENLIASDKDIETVCNILDTRLVK